MGRIVGIDLGTTSSVIAICDGPSPRVLANRDGRDETPSVASLRRRRGRATAGEEILIGELALANWVVNPEDTIVSVKRLIGRGFADPQVRRLREKVLFSIVEPSDGTVDSVRVILGGREYSPVEIVAMILRRLKEDAEYRLGEEVSHAVITVPGYFSQIQRQAIREAGIRAGLNIIKVLDDHTATALACGLGSENDEPRTLLVFDFGGGSCDVSVLMRAGNVVAPLNLEGDLWLGGDDLDRTLMERALGAIRDEYGLQIDLQPDVEDRKGRRFLAELQRAARATKEQLTRSLTADLAIYNVQLDKDGPMIDVDIEVTREEFDEMIGPLVDQTESLTRKAAKNANLPLDQIDHVLMVGGSACIPVVQRTAEQIFGSERVIRDIHPKHCVAMGAAIFASTANVGDGVVCQALGEEGRECGKVNEVDATECARCGAPLGDVASQPVELGAEGESSVHFDHRAHVACISPFEYGIRIADDRVEVLLRKGEPYPTEPKSRTFVTHHANQQVLSIPICAGVDLETTNESESQGGVYSILPAGLPANTAVRVSVWLDMDGILNVSASLDDGRELPTWAGQGGEDARAVETLQKVEKVLTDSDECFSPTERMTFHRQRERVLEEMREGRFDIARQKAEELHASLPEDPAAGEEEMRKRVPTEPTADPVARQARPGRPEVPGGVVDVVDFSVTSPGVVHAGTGFVVDIWAHLPGQRETVMRRAREAVEGGEITIKTKGPMRVARGTVLTVRLKIQELIIEEPEDTIQWEGDIGNATFAVMVPADAKEGLRLGQATFHVHGLQVARLNFQIRVGTRTTERKPIPAEQSRHRSAFASYASADRDDVLARIHGMQKAAPELEVFLDVLSFRSGQYWEQQLWKVIPEKDVFYLFWSENAQRSEWVTKEWQCALEARGIDFIDPVPLADPQDVPPPPELAARHFNDWCLAFMSSRG